MINQPEGFPILGDKKKSACHCCVTKTTCRNYNRVGVVLFIFWTILQIVSVSTSMKEISLDRYRYGNGEGDGDSVTMFFYSESVYIVHTNYSAPGEATTISSVFCPYTPNSNNMKHTVLYNSTSSICPSMPFLKNVFSPILTTSILAILSEAAIVVWMIYRGTDAGIKRLFASKCCTQMVSLILTICAISFSACAFALLPQRIDNGILQDYGSDFWNGFGCETYSSGYYYPIFCDGYNCPSGYQCDGDIDFGPGWIIGVTNFSFIVIFSFYVWLGSWCCNCCCPELESNTAVDETIVDSPSSYQIQSTIPVNNVQQYTLYVHHGGPFPSKVIVTAGNMVELENGIRNNLGISVPFKIAVFDESCSQYVMATGLQVLPYQATIQLVF